MAVSNRTFDLSTVERFKKGVQADYGKYNDPTYLGFVLLFNDFDVKESPLLVRDSKKVGSALNYLAANNQSARFEYLKMFQELLLDTNYWMPWYWQTVEGIDKVWDYKRLSDPYKGGDESRLKLTTLESIDLRITALMDLYRKACFDYEFRREIIPSNLRKFQVTIFIQEIRNIQANAGLIDAAINTVNQLSSLYPGATPISLPFETPAQKAAGETAKVTNEFGANMMFTLKKCEFDSDKSCGNFATVSNIAPEQASQVVEWTYDSIDESYINPTIQFLPPGYEGTGMNYSFLGDLPAPETGDGVGMLEKLKQLAEDPDAARDLMASAAKNAGAALAGAALNTAEQLARNAAQGISARFNSLLLGNVYGFSASNAISALQQGSLLSLGQQANVLSQNSQNERAANATPSALGNIYQQ